MDKFDLKKYLTESKLLKENSGVDDVIEILQKYVTDKLGADEPYIAEDNIPQIAEEIAMLFEGEVLNEANVGSTIKVFADLVALLSDKFNTEFIVESIKEMEKTEQLYTLYKLEKQISTVYKTLFKLA